MKVSIIIPVYNCERYLDRCVESVLQQTYRNIELILVDDGSTDDSVERLREIMQEDDRIILLQQVNAGAGAARNRGFAHSRGEYVIFLDSDDLWMPDKLEKQLKFMVDNHYQFSYTNYCEINEQSEETGKLISGPKHVTKAGMYAFCWPGCLTVMYNREQVGLIQIADIKKNNDYAMWLKVCKKADCYLLDECLAKYRRGRVGSISTHGYTTLIKWHYKLFREAEGMNPISSFIITCINMVCGLYKKKRYVKSYFDKHNG